MSIATYPPPVTAAPITLGYAETFSMAQAAPAALPGLSVTVVVPAGRRLKITGKAYANNSGTNRSFLSIREDTTDLQFGMVRHAVAASNESIEAIAIVSPSAGTHTYFLQGSADTGTSSFGASATSPAFILVEDITGSPLPVQPTSVPVGQLGYASINSNQGGITAANPGVPITGLSVNVVVPAGRVLKVTAGGHHWNSSANMQGNLRLMMDGGQFTERADRVINLNTAQLIHAEGVISPAAGAHTFSVNFSTDTGGTATFGGSPAFLLVEDITPTPAPANTAPSSTLAYAESTTNQTGITSEVDLAGCSVTVTVPAGRRLKISGAIQASNSSLNQWNVLRFQEDGGQIFEIGSVNGSTTWGADLSDSVIVTPAAGTHTYKLRVATSGGSMTAAGKKYILVEDITGATTVPVVTESQYLPITLGYAERTGNVLGIATEQDLTSLSVTVNVPADGRRIRITGFVPMFTRTAGTATYVNLIINEDGTNKQRAYCKITNDWCEGIVQWITTPSAGTHTYKLRGNSDGTVAIDIGNSIGPAFILVEDITGAGTPVSPESVPVGVLARAQVTANQTGISTQTDLVGLSVNIVVPEGRTIRLKGYVPVFNGFSASGYADLRIMEGGTLITLSQQAALSGGAEGMEVEAIISPAAGSHTYKLTAGASSGTMIMASGPTYPAFLLAEDITPTPAPAAGTPTSALGYAEVGGGVHQTGITTEVDLAGLVVTVTVPAGRRLRITAYGLVYNTTTANARFFLRIKEGGNELSRGTVQIPAVNNETEVIAQAIITPTAGVHTYKLTGQAAAGTAVWYVNTPSFLLVEDITGSGIAGHTHPELDDTGWLDLTPLLLNGWVSYDNTYGPPRYRRKNGIVYVQGLIKNGTLGPSVAQLPPGFRPSIPKILFPVERNANVIGRADVQSDGHIIGALFDAGWTSLAGIIFPADQ